MAKRTITIEGLTLSTTKASRYMLVQIADAVDAITYPNSPDLDRPALPRRLVILKGSDSLDVLDKEDMRLGNKGNRRRSYFYDLFAGRIAQRAA